MSGERHFRFDNDPVESVIIELINKKPVNSDHFSLVKRIKLTDYLKHPVSKGNLVSTVKRSKEYMASVGFAYGRLQEKNWLPRTPRQNLPHMFIPGPTIKSSTTSDHAESPPELPNPKPLKSFQKVKPLDFSNFTLQAPLSSKPQTSRPFTQISASQRQAREYLNYLNALTTGEQAFINNQISQKKQEIIEKIEKNAKITEEKMNNRGIFPEEVNKFRTSSMIPVKMISQSKICIEPMIRNAKDIVMKEKIIEWQVDPDGVGINEEVTTNKAVKKEKLFKAMEMTITKKQQKGRKKEPETGTKKVKMNWVDRLSQSMNESIQKSCPDELMFIV